MSRSLAERVWEPHLPKALADAGVRARYGVTIVCVKPEGGGFTSGRGTSASARAYCFAMAAHSSEFGPCPGFTATNARAAATALTRMNYEIDIRHWREISRRPLV